MKIGLGATFTYVLFDTGSAAFWVVKNCIGSCKANSASLPNISLNIDTSSMLPTNDAYVATCQDGVCSYGSCECNPSSATDTSVCPSTCQTGSGCNMPIETYTAVVKFGQTSFCTAIALGSTDGAGNASACGGILGILGSGDFSTATTADTENFLYNYFSSAGANSTNSNFSFRFGLGADHSIQMSTTFMDTNTSGLSWMKRYRYDNMPYVIIRLMKVLDTSGKTLADYSSSKKMVILDTGTALGGSFCSSVQTDIQTYIKSAIDLNFLFEGETANTTVSWPLSSWQYTISQDALLETPPKLIKGINNMYLCPCDADFKEDWSLMGNLFFSMKRVLVDFANSRAGLEILELPKSLVEYNVQHSIHPRFMVPAVSPTWRPRPNIPYDLRPLPTKVSLNLQDLSLTGGSSMYKCKS